MGPEKPILHPLKTPKTTVFPSELLSDSSTPSSDRVKHSDDMSTPITPPTAYTEFLKTLTPVFNSPVSASMSFPSFPSFPLDKPPNCRDPTSQPASAVAGSFAFREPDKSAPATSFPLPSPKSAAATSTGAGTGKNVRLRRLRIPPLSPPAQSPRSATTIRSPFSPSDWKDWKVQQLETPRSATGRHVSMRQVVTRTVTFKRTQLEAPPRGKRRKCNDGPPKDT